MTNDRSRSNAPGDSRGDISLPRAAILRGRNSFTSVFDSGNGVRAGRIVVKYRVIAPGDRTVVAGFVLRRGTGNAVRRNRLKRLLREAHRHERAAFASRIPTDVSLDIVVMWSGAPDEASRERLDRVRADLSQAFRKIVHRLRPRANDHDGQ